MRKATLLAIIAILFSHLMQAQEIDNFVIPVHVNGEKLIQPWVGGFNAPQFSAGDLNRDGLPDLFVFDRSGRIAAGFANTGKEGSEKYLFDEKLTANFPYLKDWVLLKDFNGDEIPDIFTAAGNTVNGIRVFRGKWENNRLAFDPFVWEDQQELLQDIIVSRNRLSLVKDTYQLYSSNADIPGIYDVDGDGDLDIITFNDGGFVATWFKNISVEQGFGLDSVLYVREQVCWGKFYESGATIMVDLSDDPNTCYSPLFQNWDEFEDDQSGGSRHAGSTLLVDDFTGNGLPDLLLGDVSFAKMVLLENHGTMNNAWMTKQDTSFPVYNMTVDLPYFPAGFMLDIDGDGMKDFVAAPNDVNNGKDTDNAWFYKNTGTFNQPRFTLQHQDFLVGDMVDVGTKSAPAFFDYNGDGLMDLVVAAGERFRLSENVTSQLFLFVNEGTASSPAFKLTDEDFLGFSQYAAGIDGTLDFTPHFADLDADGDLDLLVGEYHGGLFYAENIAGPDLPAQFGPVQYPYAGIDVGLRSAPFVYDINKDGLPDLLIGEEIGNVNYFQNVGSEHSPIFQSSEMDLPNLQQLGYVNTRGLNETSGSSAPVILYQSGVPYLVSGAANGSIQIYELNTDDLAASFVEIDHEISDLNYGRDSKCAFADLNGDGFLEMVCGNKRGGLIMKSTRFRNDTLTVGTSNHPDITGLDFVLAPNPVLDQLRISWENAEIQNVRVNIFHISGALVFSQQNAGNGRTIHTSDLPSGSYIVRLSGDSWNKSYPIVKF